MLAADEMGRWEVCVYAVAAQNVGVARLLSLKVASSMPPPPPPPKPHRRLRPVKVCLGRVCECGAWFVLKARKQEQDDFACLRHAPVGNSRATAHYPTS